MTEEEKRAEIAKLCGQIRQYEMVMGEHEEEVRRYQRLVNINKSRVEGLYRKINELETGAVQTTFLTDED